MTLTLQTLDYVSPYLRVHEPDDVPQVPDTLQVEVTVPPYVHVAVQVDPTRAPLQLDGQLP